MKARLIRCARLRELPSGGEEPEQLFLYTRRKFLYSGPQSAFKSWLGIRMTLLLSSVGSIAGCVRPEAEGYARTVEDLAGGPPLAYWRLGESGGQQMTDRMGGHHGSYVNAVQFGASGLPQDSDGAVDFAGTGYAEIPDDPGLHLSAFSLSLWFRLPTSPGEGQNWAIISKEQPGLNVGDFGVYLFENEELMVQFQDASTTHRLSTSPSISHSKNYHLCVRADNTGFDAYLNGEYLDKNTSFIDAWASNSQPIRIGFAPQLTEQANAIIDEVALYHRILSEAEVIELSQRTEAPVAANVSFVVPESQTAVLNVVNHDTFVGQKANLTVQIVSQGSFGTATVRGDKDIDFAANAVTQDQADSFTYRITDQNGTSNTATVSLTVQDTASNGGGTLVYEWAPLASWIDGVSLANRDQDDVFGPGETAQPSVNRWVQGASVGGTLLKKVGRKSNWAVNRVCWNRAPTGHPSLELFAQTGVHGVVDAYLQLWDERVEVPRHVRVVMELKTSKITDPTTHKANGLGPTSGGYPSYTASYQNSQAHQKYFCQLYSGNEPGGPINTNWWNDSSLPISRCGWMIQPGASSSSIALYLGNFDRPGVGGGSNPSSSPTAKLTDAGVNGYWHRIELEVKVTTPSTVPNNARRSEPETAITRTGDGFAKVYLTKDIDGELGTPGTRQLVHEASGLIFHPKFDDVGGDNGLHQSMNIGGVWMNWHYGGSGVALSPAYAWIRRIQVYRHDQP